MVVDSSNKLVVFGTTFSKDFPVSSNAYQKIYGGKCDIFVSKFSEDGTKLLASTYVGGTQPDGLNGVITRKYDTIWVIGGYYLKDHYHFENAQLIYNYG